LEHDDRLFFQEEEEGSAVGPVSLPLYLLLGGKKSGFGLPLLTEKEKREEGRGGGDLSPQQLIMLKIYISTVRKGEEGE